MEESSRMRWRAAARAAVVGVPALLYGAARLADVPLATPVVDVLAGTTALLAVLLVRGALARAEGSRREARELAEDLAREREFLRAVLDNLSEGIVACDGEGRLTLFNPATVRFHGLPSQPLEPEDWASYYDLYRADGETPMETDEIPLFRALNGEEVRNVEFVIAPRGGTARKLLASGTRLTDDEGETIGAVVAMRDVTERRGMEESLARAMTDLYEANSELQRSNRDLDSFASIAAHDLRAPLVGILGFADLLASSLPADEQEEAWVARIVTAAQRMDELIGDLLAYSRLGSRLVRPEQVDLAELAESVAAEHLNHRDHPEDVVRVGELPTIRGDAGQLRQLLANLVGNGLKFRRPGAPATVSVTAARIDAGWRIDVADDGVGVADEDRSRIFEMFTRGHDGYPGTGIGLAICARVAAGHGGSISVARNASGGSTFSVVLPAEVAAPVEPHGAAAPPPSPGLPDGHADVDVLLIDGDPVHRQLATTALAQVAPRLRVGVAADGTAGLEAICRSTRRPRLLLVDRDAGGLDGMALLRELRRRDLDVASTWVVAAAPDADVERGARAAGASCVDKPLTFEGYLSLARDVDRFLTDGIPA